MTIFHPKQNKFKIWKIVLASLLVVFVFLSFRLITVYSSLVELDHIKEEALNKIEELTAENSLYQEKILEILDSENLEEFAKDRNLIKEHNPQYFKAEEIWEFASQS